MTGKETLENKQAAMKLREIRRQAAHSSQFYRNDVPITAVLKQQKHRCAICKTPLKYPEWDRRDPNRLILDHDHITKKFRGILCNRCNVILGFAGDNENILRNAIKYLRKHKP